MSPLALLVLHLAMACGAEEVTSEATFPAGSVELTSDNFDQKVVADSAVWVVNFWEPACEECGLFNHVWERFIGVYDNVNFGSVDVSSEGGKALSKRFLAKGESVPNIKLFMFEEGAPHPVCDKSTAHQVIREKMNAALGGCELAADGFLQKRAIAAGGSVPEGSLITWVKQAGLNALAGKAGSHLPQVAASADGGVSISIPHGQKPDTDHWVQWVFVGAFDGETLAEIVFQKEIAYADSDKPSVGISAVALAEMKEKAGGLPLYAMEYCTKDGFWKGDAELVGAAAEGHDEL